MQDKSLTPVPTPNRKPRQASLQQRDAMRDGKQNGAGPPPVGESVPDGPIPFPISVVAQASDPIIEGIGCRIAEPYKLVGLGKTPVDLRPPAMIAAPMVKALLKWVDRDLQPAALENLASPVVSLLISASYVCRTRNNSAGAKISEHARGNAIDISGFELASGVRVSVETDWDSVAPAGVFLKTVHDAACARFTTVLGPEADRHHKTHFHFDLGKHGKTGTYRICQ